MTSRPLSPPDAAAVDRPSNVGPACAPGVPDCDDAAVDAPFGQLAPPVSGPRREILDAARELFAHYGFAKTNIGEIAQVCGMSPANLYRFFKNKHAIGLGVAQLYMSECEAIVAPIISDADRGAEARLRALLNAMVAFTVERLRATPRLVELAETVIGSEDGQALAEAYLAREIARIEALIRAGIGSGEFCVADPATAARAVHLGTKYFLAPFAIARHGLERVEHDFAITLDLLVAGLKHAAR